MKQHEFIMRRIYELRPRKYNIGQIKYRYNPYYNFRNISYVNYSEKKKNNNLNKIRENGVNQILNAINELLTDYSSKNNISLIVDKKNIIIGKTELDVTNIILDLLNKKIKKVDL